MADTRAIVRLVVDCSVVAKWELAGEQYGQEATELLRDWGAGAVEVHAPDLLPSEIGSTFLRAWRQTRITEAEARESIQNLLALAYLLHPSAPLVEPAFDIAAIHNQRIYDCFYVALAERESIDFWTSDERLYNALNAHLPFVRFIADYVARR